MLTHEPAMASHRGERLPLQALVLPPLVLQALVLQALQALVLQALVLLLLCLLVVAGAVAQRCSQPLPLLPLLQALVLQAPELLLLCLLVVARAVAQRCSQPLPLLPLLQACLALAQRRSQPLPLLPLLLPLLQALVLGVAASSQLSASELPPQPPRSVSLSAWRARLSWLRPLLSLQHAPFQVLAAPRLQRPARPRQSRLQRSPLQCLRQAWLLLQALR